MGYKGISSFDEMVKKYNDITPIRGKRANLDLRPLGNRRYWWSRIIKVNDNKYVLTDGGWTGFVNGIDAAPIVWERKEDGDYLTIRDNMVGFNSITRYWFLDRWLPRDMRFSWYQNGKHYVTYKDKEYYIAKFDADTNWQLRELKITKDHKIVFKHVGEDFVRANELMPMKTRALDKELDKEYTAKLATMWEWMLVVLPILGDSLKSSSLTDYADMFNRSYWYWKGGTTPEETRAILEDLEHPKRMAYAVMASFEIGAIKEGRFTPQADSFKKLRDVMRKTADMYKSKLA
jgi:hypothetical protein